MNHKRITQFNQQRKLEASQESGILQRAAVRSVSQSEVQSTDDQEVQPFSDSAFSKDFSRVPISTTKPQQIMAKLMIGPVGDKYEQEADRVAAQVVQRINTPASVQSGEDETVQREEMETKDNEARLMRSTILQDSSNDGGMAATPDIEASINQARGSGQPLANNIREPMEQAFGTDFSRVKVHTDTQSDQLNQSIQARAFTTGQDLFFRQGEYNPGSRGGQELIAHELTHVVQQNSSPVQQLAAKEVSTKNTQWSHKLTSHSEVIQRVKINGEEKSNFMIATQVSKDFYNNNNFDEIRTALNDSTTKDFKNNEEIFSYLKTEKKIMPQEENVISSKPAVTSSTGSATSVHSSILKEVGQVLINGNQVIVYGRGSRYKEHIKPKKALEYLKQQQTDIKEGSNNILKIGEGITKGYSKYGNIIYEYKESEKKLYYWHAHDEGVMG
ncbi:DUF4157 domain-containing protein [Nostoc sp. C117]|uniref:eCIS core domain-containing protein n=1 Tax=Nostoc sp. C117 TaxID=3349875 RepID=UPI00370DCA06